nr:hypothetical protein [Lachnospiraceae bacterium]
MDQMDQQNAYGEDLCELCGERPIDRSTGNPEEYLCRECREEKLKLRVPKWLIVALSIVCVVTSVMIGYLSTKLDKYTIGQETLSAGNEVLKEAYDLVDEKMPWSALVKIQEHLENNPENTDVALEGMRIAMKCGAYGSAAYFFSNYLADKGFTQEEINEINVYVDDISRYNDTYKAALDIMMGMQDLPGDMSSEEIESAMQEMKEKLLALEGREAYDSGLIEFYLGFYFSDSVKEAEDHMKNAT